MAGPAVEAIYGVAAVTAALRAGRRAQLHRLHVDKAFIQAPRGRGNRRGNAGGGPKQDLQHVRKAAEDRGVPIVYTHRKALADKSGRACLYVPFGSDTRRAHPGPAQVPWRAQLHAAVPPSGQCGPGQPVPRVEGRQRAALAGHACPSPGLTGSPAALAGPAGGRPNQGVVLECSPLPLLPEPPTSLQPHAAAAPAGLAGHAQGHPHGGAAGLPRAPVWLAADLVQDPMNLGSLIRSALFYGVDKVLWEKGCAPLSSAVSKASAGAAECMDIHEVDGGLARFLERARGDGWSVVGATDHPSDRHQETLCSSALGAEVTGATVLVVGNEGSGLRKAVLQACTTLVHIHSPLKQLGHACSHTGAAAPAWVPSLNVGVATGALLHQLCVRKPGT